MTTAIQHWSDQLPQLACVDAVEWCQHYDTFDEAWQACERGDWMLWLIGHYAGGPGSDKRRPLVLAACECTRLILHQIPSRERRPHAAIEIAEKWARGEDGVSLEDVRSAARAAYVAAVASADVAGAVIAGNASAAAQTSYAAAPALAAHAAHHSVMRGARKACVDIVRKYYPTFEIGGR